uniref:Cytochrome c3 family protein n=2 Tax=Gymnodinialimonas phycosphaerae TaxID=2841589 RepID=A0A975TSU8_9RHOB
MMFRSLAALAMTFVLLPASATFAQDDAPSLTDITEAWLASPHADRTSEAFTHWNEDGEITGACAVCHSSIGLLDYLESPMETVGVIDHPVPLGSVVGCASCHSAAAVGLASVPFPSGEHIALDPGSAVCSVCHQGRASTGTVEAAIGDLAADTVSADLGFVNSHYSMAGATTQGSAAHGGYEYAGQTYAGPFTHFPELNTCSSCHSPHSLQVELTSCTSCHEGAESFTDIRTSTTDYDGDGNAAEGIADPIATLHAQLGEAIALYAAEVAGTPIIYAPGAYPYYFTDTDGDGAVTEGEAAYPNRYQTWTPRLLRAAYNYQYVLQDGGAFVHNPHYALQLLFDALADLGTAVDVDTSALTRP